MNIFAYLCDTKNFKNKEKWNLSKYALTDERNSPNSIVRDFVRSAEHLQMFLPVIVFVIGCLLAFATGTSWGTMGILIPVAVPVFAGSSLLPAAVAAVCAGAVMGDHCSPISDTTILSSAGAECNHLRHVATQLPYASLVAVICLFGYLVAGFTGSPWPSLIGGIAVALVVVIATRVFGNKEAA